MRCMTLAGLGTILVALLLFAVPGGCPNDQSGSTGTTSPTDTGDGTSGDGTNGNGDTSDGGNDGTADTGVIFDNGNIDEVANDPLNPTVVEFDQAYRVTLIRDYHWNDAQGATPGTIALQAEDGTTYGPWQTTGSPGQDNVPNAYWTCYPDDVVPAGTYTVIDSDPATWSHNAGSGNCGMTYIEATPVGNEGQPGGTGTITGTVVDAQTGDPLADVLVTLTGTEHTATTATDGKFALNNVAAGEQPLSLTLDGYVTGSTTALVVADQTVDVSVGLVKQAEVGAEVVALVLTWGTEPTQPKDLDLHLSGPDGAGGRFHIYYNSMTSVEHAFLDLDDVEWGGPETITIRRASGGDFVAGEYHVWVHNYSTTPEFTGSGAVVTLFANGEQIGQYSVADATGDPALDIWQVVNITVDAAGNITHTSVQQVLAEGTDTTVF